MGSAQQQGGLSALEAVRLCASVYDARPAGFERVISVSSIVGGIVRTDGGTAVIFRGSADLGDWMRDLEADPTELAPLGYVHAGFAEGVPQFLEAVRPYLSGNLFLAGHSLGAAHACLMAALLGASGIAVQELTLFGCPRPGFTQLGEWVRKNVRTIRSYRNGSDPVPLVPALLWFYKPVVPPEQIGFNGDPENPVEDHYIANYVRAVEAHCATS